MTPSICVIGGGVIGMTSAVNIAESLPAANVTVLADTFTPNTTSDVAAGLCFPHRLADTSEHLVRRWFRRTLDYLLSVYKSPVASEAGVSMLTGYMMSSTTDPLDVPGVEKTFGLRQMPTEEFPMCGTANTSGIEFTTLLAEGGRFLPWLMDTFKAKGGQIVCRKILALSELYEEFDILVNCTGIGANQLVSDDSMQPVRGQVIRVEAPWIKHFYIDDEFYVIPGINHVTLGGAEQEGDWNLSAAETDRDRIWEGCVRLVPSLERARVIADKVGLRPCRHSVRLEREDVAQLGPTTPQIVHNYGHGGAGITLSWGCALDTVQLVKDCVNNISCQK